MFDALVSWCVLWKVSSRFSHGFDDFSIFSICVVDLGWIPIQDSAARSLRRFFPWGDSFTGIASQGGLHPPKHTQLHVALYLHLNSFGQGWNQSKLSLLKVCPKPYSILPNPLLIVAQIILFMDVNGPKNGNMSLFPETSVKRRLASCFLRLRSALRSFSLALRQVKINWRWELYCKFPQQWRRNSHVIL